LRPSATSRFDARQVCVLIVALLSAGILLAPAPGARGETHARPNVDKAPGGATHVAGELLVLYEPGTSPEPERAVVRRSGGRTLKDLPGKVRLVAFPDVRRAGSGARKRALQQKLEGLRNEPRVEAVDYNYIRRASLIPDDEKFGAQWGLHTVHFPGTWNDARGAGAQIAIVDPGIDKSHSDIGKIAAQKNFFNGGNVVKDRYGHGTHVAGTAAALTNNDRGVAGGCPACKLLVAKVMDASGGVKDSNLIAGIKWSVNHRADVINLSLGGPERSSVLEATIDKAYANGKGAVVVAAAGNERTTRKQYPAAYPAAIAVSATNDNDKLAGFSSRGDWVDLAAPGTRILSTRAAIAGGGYGRESGTSESASLVSALAGLLASEGKTAGEIRKRMQDTATDLGPAGIDPYYGHGRIDANRAVP
jgi:thermitase